MRVPQVNERVKEAPAQALRAMFAGIGQLMLFTDRLRNRPAHEAAKAGQEAAEASVPAQAPDSESAAPTAPAAETATAETVAAQEPVKEEVAEAPAAAPEETTPEAPAAEAPEAPATAEPPLPNYDELTVPSLRARMRNLSAEQLNELIAYEGAHANRADVIAMFNRRIAKLAEG